VRLPWRQLKPRWSWVCQCDMRCEIGLIRLTGPCTAYTVREASKHKVFTASIARVLCVLLHPLVQGGSALVLASCLLR
jgi:hypothetical protein